MKNLLLLFVVTLFLGACNNDNENHDDDEYLIFGHYFGECQGEECLEYFRVTETTLIEYEDNCSPGILSSCIPDNEELSAAKFEYAKDLIDDFPEELYDEMTTIGCPDCGDQGGLYLEIRKDDNIRYWNLDYSNSALPTYLQAYTDEVKAAISAIND